MSKEVKRYNFDVDKFGSPRAYESEHGRWMKRADYEAILAERDALKNDADRRVPLYEAIERACGEIPDGWSIQLCIERWAGWVELRDADGVQVVDFATNNERLDYTVIDALEHALQGEQP